jgi:hypothetical protein
MTSSLLRVVRLSAVPLQSTVMLLDRRMGLQDIALRNAARAVASDRVAARLRADAAASLAASVAPAMPAVPRPSRELTLVG